MARLAGRFEEILHRLTEFGSAGGTLQLIYAELCRVVQPLYVFNQLGESAESDVMPGETAMGTIRSDEHRQKHISALLD